MTITTASTPKTASLRDWRYRYRNLPYYIFLIIWSLITIFIFLWLTQSSFKTNREVFGSPWTPPATPLSAAEGNYGKAWNLSHMSVYFANSVIVTLFAVLAVVLVSLARSLRPFAGELSWKHICVLLFHCRSGVAVPTHLGTALRHAGKISPCGYPARTDLDLCRCVDFIHDPVVNRLFPDAPHRTGGRRRDRWLLRVRYLLEGDDAFGWTRIVHRGYL